MRIFTTILAFLMLSLSCIPCADSIVANISAGEKLVAQHGMNDLQHKDDCSPLCTCSCCGPVTFVSVHPFVDYPLTHGTVSYGCYIASHIQDILLPVWQPPQLS